MAEIPGLHLDSSSRSMEMNMGAQKISVSDHMGNGKSDSFIVDMEGISNGGGKDNDVSTNSRITLQRNLSRKGTHRGADDRNSLLVSCSSPPRGPSSTTPEDDASTHSQPPPAFDQHHNRHHQITMNTSNIISTATVPDNRRSNMSHRRTPWFSPKRVLLFFATLSSIGTMLLICFTLAAGKTYDNDSGKGWHP